MVSTVMGISTQRRRAVLVNERVCVTGVKSDKPVVKKKVSGQISDQCGRGFIQYFCMGVYVLSRLS